MLNYQGKLYAKSGDTYLPLKETAADFDRLKDENHRLKVDLIKATLDNGDLLERIKGLEYVIKQDLVPVDDILPNVRRQESPGDTGSTGENK